MKIYEAKNEWIINNRYKTKFNKLFKALRYCKEMYFIDYVTIIEENGTEIEYFIR